MMVPITLHSLTLIILISSIITEAQEQTLDFYENIDKQNSNHRQQRSIDSAVYKTQDGRTIAVGSVENSQSTAEYRPNYQSSYESDVNGRVIGVKNSEGDFTVIGGGKQTMNSQEAQSLANGGSINSNTAGGRAGGFKVTYNDGNLQANTRSGTYGRQANVFRTQDGRTIAVGSVENSQSASYLRPNYQSSYNYDANGRVIGVKNSEGGITVVGGGKQAMNTQQSQTVANGGGIYSNTAGGRAGGFKVTYNDGNLQANTRSGTYGRQANVFRTQDGRTIAVGSVENSQSASYLRPNYQSSYNYDANGRVIGVKNSEGGITVVGGGKQAMNTQQSQTVANGGGIYSNTAGGRAGGFKVTYNDGNLQANTRSGTYDRQANVFRTQDGRTIAVGSVQNSQSTSYRRPNYQSSYNYDANGRVIGVKNSEGDIAVVGGGKQTMNTQQSQTFANRGSMYSNTAGVRGGGFRVTYNDGNLQANMRGGSFSRQQTNINTPYGVNYNSVNRNGAYGQGQLARNSNGNLVVGGGRYGYNSQQTSVNGRYGNNYRQQSGNAWGVQGGFARGSYGNTASSWNGRGQNRMAAGNSYGGQRNSFNRQNGYGGNRYSSRPSNSRTNRPSNSRRNSNSNSRSSRPSMQRRRNRVG